MTNISKLEKSPINMPKIICNFATEISFKHIHKDSRGEIMCFYKDGIEYTLLTTKKGYARGGCVHPRNLEHFVILHGTVRYAIMYPSDELFRTYGEGESGFIPHGIPHYFVALEDSMTLEWGAEIDEKNTRDLVARNIVDGINETKEIDDIILDDKYFIK